MRQLAKTGFWITVGTVSARLAWTRPWQAAVPPSERLGAWVPGAQFRDTVTITGVHASPAEVFEALGQVLPSDMPVATLIGLIRYLPARLTGAQVPAAGGVASESPAERPFMTELLEGGGNLLLEEAPGVELIIGVIGRFHNLRNQQFVALDSPESFRTFDQPGYQKLAMSVRILPGDPGAGLTLALEHRTLALDEQARRLFALYWLGIKPGGAFVTAQLLAAAKRRAEAMHRRASG